MTPLPRMPPPFGAERRTRCGPSKSRTRFCSASSAGQRATSPRVRLAPIIALCLPSLQSDPVCERIEVFSWLLAVGPSSLDSL